MEEGLRATSEPVLLEVVDRSYRHSVPIGSKSHFKVVLTSDYFMGERFLNRHRMVYSTSMAEPSTAVHAFALYTYTIKEREALQDMTLTSPSCRGAGSIAQRRIRNNRHFSSMSPQTM